MANILNKVTSYLQHYGPVGLLKKVTERTINTELKNYDYSLIAPSREEQKRQREKLFVRMPLISILVPLCDPQDEFLKELLTSVMQQSYSNWQLCLVDAGNNKKRSFVEVVTKNDGRVVYREIENQGIAANTNEALFMAEGEYITLLDHDDLLSADALYCMVEKLNETGAECIYSDEDKIDMDGKNHFMIHRKPDFNLGLLRSNNYICHLFMVKRELAIGVGGFDSWYDGAQDYDFILKCVEKAGKVAHVPRVLYHWRTHRGSTSSNPMSKIYAYDAGKRAIEAHLKRAGISAKVSLREDFGFYKVTYDSEKPDIRIIVYGVKDSESAKEYFSYIRENTDYDSFVICAMNEHDRERIDTFPEKYVVVLRVGMVLENKDWLKILVGRLICDGADAASAKILAKNRLAYAGTFSDNVDDIITYIGKPGWFKGSFNRFSLQCDVSCIPTTGIALKMNVYHELFGTQSKGRYANIRSRAGSDGRTEYRFFYEPDCIIKI